MIFNQDDDYMPQMIDIAKYVLFIDKNIIDIFM